MNANSTAYVVAPDIVEADALMERFDLRDTAAVICRSIREAVKTAFCERVWYGIESVVIIDRNGPLRARVARREG